MKCIYGKGNTLIRKFKYSSPEVKTSKRFQSYCTNMVCAELWNDYKVNILNQLKVTYNNVSRHLSVKRPCSITQVFLENKVNSFKVIHRKSMLSLWTRITKSENVLIQTITKSMYFSFSSKLFKSWREELFTL